MDRQIEAQPTDAASTNTDSSNHLMCRTSLWGAVTFLGCAYFAGLSFERVATNQLEWPHDVWTAITYLVWIGLLALLTFQTRCLRERIFFSTLFINFLIGLGLTVWHTVPEVDVRTARLGTGVLWVFGALVSLSTIGRAVKVRQ
jgi:hypothetical protein